MNNHFYVHMDDTVVDAAAIFHKENRVEPVSFRLDDTEYKISHVLEETRGEMLKKRGAGIRYKIRVSGGNYLRESYLFRIGDLWYLAEEDDIIPDIQTRHKGLNYRGKRIIDSRYDNPYKIAVDVAAVCYTNGDVEPYALWWEDGAKYHIDRVLEHERTASLKAGIIGTRYKICLMGKETFMFRDDDLWFMERKDECRVLDVHGRPVC